MPPLKTPKVVFHPGLMKPWVLNGPTTQAGPTGLATLYWFEHPLELKEMRQKYRDYGKTLSVKRSAKIALGNLEGLTLK